MFTLNSYVKKYYAVGFYVLFAIFIIIAISQKQYFFYDDYAAYSFANAPTGSFLTIVDTKRIIKTIGDAAPVSDKLILPEALPGSSPCWFGFLITVREGLSREKIVREIETKGIQTRMLFAGNLVKHSCFDEMRETGTGYRISGTLENTDRIMRDSFWIGVYPGMTDEMIEYMAEKITEAMA